MTHKRCNGCLQEKLLDEFWKRGGQWPGYLHLCKPCKSASMKAKRKENPEREKRRNHERYWANRDGERERHLVKKYGITLAIYAEMLAAQGGVCAICGIGEPENRTLDVDHDHETGEVRGLLCTSCNRMLGHAGDSEERLRAGADYLLSRK